MNSGMGIQSVLLDTASAIRVYIPRTNYVTIYAGEQSLSISIDGMTYSETIDLLCAKLQAAKTTEKREGE